MSLYYFCQIASIEIPLYLNSFFISSSYTDELWAIYEDIMTKKRWKFMIFDCGSCSVIEISVLSDLTLKLQANQSMLTFKVKEKFKKESFNSCLQL